MTVVSAIGLADRALGRLLRAIPMVCLVALFAILFGNVISRTFQIWSLAWFDEIVEALFAVMVFIGAAALWREHEHFRVDWLESMLQAKPRQGLRVFSILLSVAFLGLMALRAQLEKG